VAFIVRPHPQDQDYPLLREHLVDETMLDVDPTGAAARQVAHQTLVGRRAGEGIVRDDVKKMLRTIPEV